MKVKFKDHKYDNGYIIKAGSQANEIINRKIFSKENDKYEKVYIGKNDFSLWKPTSDDLPDLINSVDFFSKIKKTSFKFFLFFCKISKIANGKRINLI